MGKKLFELLMKNNFIKKSNRIENWKLIKKKGDQLYVKWKGYNNSFDSWIDKKRHNIN